MGRDLMVTLYSGYTDMLGAKKKQKKHNSTYSPAEHVHATEFLLLIG